MYKEPEIKTSIKDLKQDHILKITYTPGKSSSNIPMLTIQGRWFQLLGYKVGEQVKVTVDENNRLIIEKLS